MPDKPEIVVVVMPSAQGRASADTAAIGTAFLNQPALGPDEELYQDEESLWTDWLVRPIGSPAFWYDINDEVEYQHSYGDEIGEPGHSDPLKREYVKKYITGVRFRNTGEKPVVVRLHLSGSF